MVNPSVVNWAVKGDANGRFHLLSGHCVAQISERATGIVQSMVGVVKGQVKSEQFNPFADRGSFNICRHS